MVVHFFMNLKWVKSVLHSPSFNKHTLESKKIDYQNIMKIILQNLQLVSDREFSQEEVIQIITGMTPSKINV